MKIDTNYTELTRKLDLGIMWTDVSPLGECILKTPILKT